MTTIYDLKPMFQNLLRPIVGVLHARGITPNQVTVSAMILSIVTGILVLIFKDSSGIFLIIPIVLFVRMALNAIDGIMAKEYDMQTPKGAFLNEMGDVISDAALYLPFTMVASVNSIIVVLFVVVAIFTEMAGVLAQAISNDRRYDGPMGKSDRAVLVGFIALVIGFGVEAGFWTNLLFAVALILAVWTTIRRISKAIA